jgi:hypothetical protein
MKIRKQKKEAKKRQALIMKQNERFKERLKKQLENPVFTILKP